MEGKAVVRTQAGLGDLLELLAKALLSGIGVAIAMSLAILALCATAQAATPDDLRTAALVFPTATADGYLVAPTQDTETGIEAVETVVETGLRGNQPWSVASTPSHDAQAAGVGALWASGKAADPLDDEARGTDSATTLHLLLGLVALMSVAMVAVIGRADRVIADRGA